MEARFPCTIFWLNLNEEQRADTYRRGNLRSHIKKVQ